jgi:hypothetical protein
VPSRPATAATPLSIEVCLPTRRSSMEIQDSAARFLKGTIINKARKRKAAKETLGPVVSVGQVSVE